MSPKQEIYREFLRTTLPYIRDRQSLSFWRRWGDASVYEEAELIHNLWPSLFEAEFTDHDFWFLNAQTESYYRRASSSPLYAQHVALIRELFTIVPIRFRSQLRWSGPSTPTKVV